MKKNILYISLVLTFSVMIGCDNDFSPYQGNIEGLLVYSVFDNRLPYQEVLVSNINNKENRKDYLGHEFYIFQDENKHYKLRDTNIADDKYVHYYSPDFKYERGKSYSIREIKDSLITQWGDFFVPDTLVVAGNIAMSLTPKISFPITIDFDFNLLRDKNFETADYYYCWITKIEYEVIENGQKVIKYRSIPNTIVLDPRVDVSNTSEIDYPEEKFGGVFFDGFKNTMLQNTTPTLVGDQIVLRYSYPILCPIYAFKFMRGTHRPEEITIKRAFVVMQTCSKDLYEKYIYISDAQLTSSRMDQLKYQSNMMTSTGTGYGFFGAVTVDTLQVQIPNAIIEYFGYKNGQK